MEYKVTFSKYYTYLVDAECEDKAEEIAYDMFSSDMRYPVADTSYDEVDIECTGFIPDEV